MGQFPRKLRFAFINKCYKIALHLNRFNFRTVKAIDFLSSTPYTTSFLYGKIHFGVLHLLSASIATFDTPPSSNSPELSVGIIKSLQIRFVGRERSYTYRFVLFVKGRLNWLFS